eukprot:scaffold1847_cov343-Prasinococcus_capsulatus_cf.AAC.18
MHIFGHTHFGWDATIGKTRFVQAALSYPQERKSRWPSIAIGELETRPVQIFDGENFVEELPCRWSDFYKRTARNPSDTENLAPYVASMYRRAKRQGTSS